jgi:hypothetical protein
MRQLRDTFLGTGFFVLLSGFYFAGSKFYFAGSPTLRALYGPGSIGPARLRPAQGSLGILKLLASLRVVGGSGAPQDPCVLIVHPYRGPEL